MKKRVSILLGLVGVLFIVILFVFMFSPPSVAKFTPKTPLEVNFLKTDNANTLSLRERYLADVNRQHKHLDAHLYGEFSSNHPNAYKVKHTPINQLDFSHDVIITRFPKVMINDREVYLYPELNQSVETLIAENRTLVDEFNAEWLKLQNGNATILDEETALDQDILDYMTVCYLGLNDEELAMNSIGKINQNEIAELLDKLSVANNAKENDRILRLIYSKDYSLFDETVIAPGSFEGAIFYNENIISDPYSKEKLAEMELKNQQVVPLSTYNRWAAIQYAFIWWSSTNNYAYPYYAKYFNQDSSRIDYNELPYDGYEGRKQSQPKRAWQDCTNFVSQALTAGGLFDVKDWYYKNTRPSSSWGGAQFFSRAFTRRFGKTSIQNVTIGDVIQVVRQNSGEVIHTTIITADKGNTVADKYVTYHTTDRLNINANSLFSRFKEPIYLYCYHIK